MPASERRRHGDVLCSSAEPVVQYPAGSCTHVVHMALNAPRLSTGSVALIIRFTHKSRHLTEAKTSHTFTVIGFKYRGHKGKRARRTWRAATTRLLYEAQKPLTCRLSVSLDAVRF